MSTYEPSDISPRQTELATSLRVPLVTSTHPDWHYIGAIVVSDEVWCPGQMPTDAEVRMVGSFIEEYREYWYNSGWKARMAEFASYDIDGGANGVCFIKHPHGGWGYRKRTWIYGPPIVPSRIDEPQPLLAVLDRVHTGCDEVSKRWVEWKAAHPEVFGTGAVTA